MGASYVDYIVADRFVIPDEHRAVLHREDRHAARRLSVQRPAAARSPTPRPRAPSSACRTNAFVFCCFNNSNKLTPEMFALWMRLLQQVEGSVLWLLEDNPAASRNLRREADRARRRGRTSGVRAAREARRAPGAPSRRRSLPRYAALRRAHDRKRCAVVGTSRADLLGNDLCRPGRRKPAQRGGSARTRHGLACERTKPSLSNLLATATCCDSLREKTCAATAILARSSTPRGSRAISKRR